ncbi:MAG: hypothetical protein K2J86_08980 [Prevotella sp.]|nr:hypothetical protein [Prevotella sp.]
MKRIFTPLMLTLLALLGGTNVSAQTTVTYAVQEGETHAAGETVEVKDSNDEAVATLTFGFAGEADYKAGKKSSVGNFVAYTEGNGVNGKENSGTNYFIAPKYDGEIEVGVVLNVDKAFFVLEDGTALEDYNGIKVTEKYTGTYKFNVTGGKTYQVYCSGSKLGFHGFNYTFTPAGPNTPPTADEVTALTADMFYLIPISEPPRR